MSVTYGQNDNYTDIYDGKMVNCCQKVRGNKANQRPKQQQNKKEKENKQTNKTTTNKTKQNNNKQNKTTTNREEGGWG